MEQKRLPASQWLLGLPTRKRQLGHLGQCSWWRLLAHIYEMVQFAEPAKSDIYAALKGRVKLTGVGLEERQALASALLPPASTESRPYASLKQFLEAMADKDDGSFAIGQWVDWQMLLELAREEAVLEEAAERRPAT